MESVFRTQVSIDGVSKVVEIHREASGVRIVVDGQPMNLGVQGRSGSKHQVIEVDGDTLPFGVMRTDKGYQIVIDGTVYEATTSDPRAAHYASLVKPPAAASRELVKAPMPGMVVSVLVKVGDQVNPGDTLLTLNAMKLENDIRATKAGSVQEVWAEPDMAVEKGTKLVLIE